MGLFTKITLQILIAYFTFHRFLTSNKRRCENVKVLQPCHSSCVGVKDQRTDVTVDDAVSPHAQSIYFI